MKAKLNVLTPGRIEAQHDAQLLRSFLLTMAGPEQRLFARSVQDRLDVTRDSWFNWLYGKCRIPMVCKTAIERLARVKVF